MLQQYFLFKKLGELQVEYIKFEQQTQILTLQANSSESWSCNNFIWPYYWTIVSSYFQKTLMYFYLLKLPCSVATSKKSLSS